VREDIRPTQRFRPILLKMKFLHLLLCAAIAVTSSIPAAVAETDRPNIVLIISDDHAWNDYGFMGHQQIKTPSLDRLAAESLVFPRGYVPSSLCCPSLASMITGRYPHQHKVTGNDPPMPPGMKPGEFFKTSAFTEGREVMNRNLSAAGLLTQKLGERGYLSLQTGKWWQGDFRQGGFTHGMTKGGRHGDQGLDIGRKTMQPIYDFIGEAQDAKKPFFVWYAPMLPHTPHNPPARLMEKYKALTPSIHVARYWAMVEWFDEGCGELLKHLEEKGLAQNTIVAYVADNGWIQDPNRGTYTHRSKRSPYDGGLRTPIMVRWPGKVKPQRSDSLASSLDLMPTLLKAAGVTPAADLPGIDLLDPEAVDSRKTLFGGCFVHTLLSLDKPAENLLWRWVIDERWKLIVPRTHASTGLAAISEPGMGETEVEWIKSGRVELYDVLADPEEARNLAGEKPEIVSALLKKLDGWWKPSGS
jgi:arylsulfatase A-like enzyme